MVSTTPWGNAWGNFVNGRCSRYGTADSCVSRALFSSKCRRPYPSPFGANSSLRAIVYHDIMRGFEWLCPGVAACQAAYAARSASWSRRSSCIANLKIALRLCSRPPEQRRRPHRQSHTLKDGEVASDDLGALRSARNSTQPSPTSLRRSNGQPSRGDGPMRRRRALRMEARLRRPARFG
jgi:hypothetical protein